MTKKQYILLGSTALIVTLVATSALILTLRNAFVNASEDDSVAYTRVPIAKIFAQSIGYDGEHLDRCLKNQQIAIKAQRLDLEAGRLLEQNQAQRAYDLENESIDLFKIFPGLNCIQAVGALEGKAECEAKLGLLEEREKTLRLLLDISTQTFNANHEKVASAAESLGDLLSNADRQREALPYLNRAYDIRSKGEATNSPKLAYTASLLAHCQLDLKAYEKADELYNQAIIIYKQQDGNGFSESQQIARENLANSYRWQNRQKEALACELAVLQDLKDKHLANSTFAAAMNVSAANTSQDSHDSISMKKYLSAAEEILAHLQGPSDERERAQIYNNLADVYHDDSQYKAELSSRQLCIQNYQALKYAEDDDQSELAQNMIKAGSCALKLKDFAQAKTLYAQALEKASTNQEVRLKIKADKAQLLEYLAYLKHIHANKNQKPLDDVGDNQEAAVSQLLVDDKTTRSSALN